MGRSLFGSRIGVAVFASVVTAAAVGGVSYAVAATTGGGASTFYGCSSATGALRSSSIRVDSPPTCKTGETPQSWDAQGATGPQGAVGQASVVTLPAVALCPQPPDPQDPSANAGTLGFLQVPGIPGESTDADHPNWIGVVSWSWGTTSGSGASQSRVCDGESHSSIDELTVVKGVDSASNKFMLANVRGDNLGTIILALRRLGRSQDFLTLTLDNAFVTSWQFLGTGSGGAHGDGTPLEKVTFHTSRVHVGYKRLNVDGSYTDLGATCWDATTLTAC